MEDDAGGTRDRELSLVRVLTPSVGGAPALDGSFLVISVDSGRSVIVVSSLSFLAPSSIASFGQI